MASLVNPKRAASSGPVWARRLRTSTMRRLAADSGWEVSIRGHDRSIFDKFTLDK